MKKFIFMLIFCLCMFSSVIFAGENLTVVNFQKILKEKGINLSSDYEFDTNLISILQENPVIIYNDNKVYIYATKQDKYCNFGFGVAGEKDYMSYFFGLRRGSSVEIYKEFYNNPGNDFLLKTYILNLDDNSYLYVDYAHSKYTRYSSFYESYVYNYFSSEGEVKTVTNNGGPACFGLTIDTLSQTVDDFKKPKVIKKFLDEHLIFNGYGPLTYYYDNKLIDVSYLFDGVFLGRHTSSGPSLLPNGVFSLLKLEGDTVGFNFKPLNFDYADYAVFYLQEISLEAVPYIGSDDFLIDEPFQQSIVDLINYAEFEDLTSKSFYFSDLRKKLEEDKIYRLLCISSFNGLSDSGDSVITNYYDSTCFFSLNDWDSEYIKVLNISNVEDIDPTKPFPSGSGDSDVDIGGYVDSINDTITDTILGTDDGNGNRTGGLLGGIIDFFTNLLKDFWQCIVNLIIPTTEQFGDWITKTYEDVNKTGGILLYSKQFWIALLGLINNEEPNDLIFNIPEIKSPLSDTVIYEGTEFNITKFVNEHEAFKTFYTIYIVIVSGLAIFEFCKYMWSLWDHIINGTGSVEISEDEEFGVGVAHAGAKMKRYVYSKGTKKHYRFR